LFRRRSSVPFPPKAGRRAFVSSKAERVPPRSEREIASGPAIESTGGFTVDGMAPIRISQLAERSRVPATASHLHGNEEPLPDSRTPAGYRGYGGDALERLSFIGTAEHVGLEPEEIGKGCTSAPAR